MSNLAYLSLRIKEYVRHSLLWLSSTLCLVTSPDDLGSIRVKHWSCQPCARRVLCQLLHGESLANLTDPALIIHSKPISTLHSRQSLSWEACSLVFLLMRQSSMAAGLPKVHPQPLLTQNKVGWCHPWQVPAILNGERHCRPCHPACPAPEGRI